MSAIASMPIIDVDSHISEPPDLWTSRMSKQWGDAIPHVEWDEASQEFRWRIAGILMTGIGHFSCAGWDEPYPLHPAGLDDADPACYDPNARLKKLDDWGIHAQVLYPNILGFDTHVFMTMEPQLGLECVRAYNDFQTDFVSADPSRFAAITALPIWNMGECVAEMERCAAAGHRGILLPWECEKIGLPDLASEAWYPVLAAAEAMELPVNFHVGFGSRDITEIEAHWTRQSRAAILEHGYDRVGFAGATVMGFLKNGQSFTNMILNGVCHRFPRLKFVSVESGFGYVPFLLEALDWQWVNTGAYRDHPERDLPSEYFHRQMFATFWFETPNPDLLTTFQDNVMFETDFPHPTSLSPGPQSSALPARETVQKTLAGVAPEVAEKVLYKNAAALYKL